MLVGRHHRLQRRAPRVGDRPRRQPLVRVRVVGVVAIVEVDAADAAVPLLAGGRARRRHRAAVDDGRVGLQQLGLERRHAQAVDEHLRDARPLLGAAGLLLDDRRQHDDLVVVEARASSSAPAAPLACAARSSPHTWRWRRTSGISARAGVRVRAQPVGVGEQVALERRCPAAPAPRRTPDRSPSPPARPCRRRRPRRGSPRPRAGSCPAGTMTVTSSSAAPFTSVSRICFGVAGAAIS